MTRMIKRVEDVLGTSLFERTTRSVSITDAGREFIAVARRISDDLRIAVDGMRELADRQRGQVVVSTIMSVANSVLPEIIADYRSAYPGIEVRLQDGIHGNVVDDVRNRSADFGINYLQDIPSDIETKRLGHGTLDLVANQNSDLGASGKKSIRFEELSRLPLVSMPVGSQTRRVLDMTASQRGIRLRHEVVVSQIPTLLSLVRAGVGFAIVPSTSLSQETAGDLIRLRVSDPEISIDIGLLISSELRMSPAAEGLIDMITDAWSAD